MGQIFSDEYDGNDDKDGKIEYRNDSTRRIPERLAPLAPLAQSAPSAPLVGGRVPFHVAIHTKKMKSLQQTKLMNCKKTANEIVRLYHQSIQPQPLQNIQHQSANAPISNMFIDLQLDSACYGMIKDTLQEKKMCMEKVPFEEWTTVGPRMRFRGPTEYVKVQECQKSENSSVAYVAMTSGTPNLSMWKESK